MSYQIDYTPHPKQLEVHQNESRFRVLVCGRKSGKTTLSVIEAIICALSQDAATIWVLAPTYRQAKLISWRMLLQYIPPEIIRRKNEVELTLQLIRDPNDDRYDSFISLKGCEDENALRGIPGIDFVILDEYAYMKKHIWPMIIEPALRITQGRALFVGTPKGFNHLYEAYMLGQPGPKHDKDWASWQFPSWANPFFPDSERKKIQKFYRKTDGTYDDFYYQEYEADFRRHAGLIYKEFDPNIHVIQPFKIPDGWLRMPALDFGYTHPMVCLWGAVDPQKNNIYIYREYYERGKRLTEAAEDIMKLTGEEMLEAGPADPSRPDSIDELTNLGLPCYPANNNVTLGIDKVADYLRLQKLFIFSTCEKTIWEMQRYEWKAKRGTGGQELREVPMDVDNDTCLVGETELLTRRGKVIIKDIVAGDVVWTPFGWQPVLTSTKTGVKETVSVTFSDRSKITGTGEHKIWNGDKFLPLDSLRYGDILKVWQNKSSLKGRNTTDILTLHTATSGCTSAKLVANLSTVLFGKATMEKSQMGATSTIKTTIRLITILPIWIVFQLANIGLITLRKILRTPNLGNGIKNIWKKLDRLLRRGTHRRKEKSGTDSTVRPLGKRGNQEHYNVNNVEKATKHLKQATPVSVPTIVKVLGDGRLSWITKPARVWCAFKITKLINTILVRPAHENVLVVSKVERSRKRSVYNITVSGGVFFLDGVCVSNCDSLRYLMMEQPDLMAAPDDDAMILPRKRERITGNPIMDKTKINEDAMFGDLDV